MQLTPFEKEKQVEILKAGNYDYLADLEETAEGSRSYHYEVHPSNIGDSVYLIFNGRKQLLSDPDSF